MMEKILMIAVDAWLIFWLGAMAIGALVVVKNILQAIWRAVLPCLTGHEYDYFFENGKMVWRRV